MTAKATEPKEQSVPVEKPECFVIMPISDREGYEPGHFKRVYDWIIKPACEAAGYRPVRGDDVSSSHLIVADILKRIVEAPMAICDVSSLNANVMFELGIRQAFGKPVALIKDERTTSVFDISGLRYTEYASSLRADLVKANSNQLATMIKETGEADSGMTSLMSLVDIDAAAVPQSAEVSDDSKLILQEIHKLSSRLANVERSKKDTSYDLWANNRESGWLHNDAFSNHVDGLAMDAQSLEGLSPEDQFQYLVDEGWPTDMIHNRLQAILDYKKYYI